jgi:PAS domain S-box-containing protein
MKIYGKILLATLPLVLLGFLVAGGITYYLSRGALTEIAEQWLETRGLEALNAARDQAEYLKEYGLDTVDASVKQAQFDAMTAMANINLGEQGFVFVIDDAGKIVHHPEPSLIDIDISAQSWFTEMRGHAAGWLSYDFEGVGYLASFHRFDLWNWFVVVTDPEAEVYGAVNQLGSYVLVLGVVGSALIALVLMVLTRRVTSPLAALVAGAEDVGRGKLDTRIAVTTRDEIGVLARAFNEMIEQLRVLYGRIEERLTTVVSNAPIILFSLDAHGQITLLEGKGLEALGLQSDEVIGQDVSEVFERAPEFLQSMGVALGGDTDNAIAAFDNLIFEIWCAPMGETAGGGVIGVATDVTERIRAEKRLLLQNEYLSALHDTTLGMISRLDLTELLSDLITRAGQLLGTQHGYIYLVEDNGEALDRHVGVGVFGTSIGHRLQPNEGVAGKVWKSGKALVINDYVDWEDRVGSIDYDVAIGAMMGAPLKSGVEVIGVLGMAYDVQTEQRFGEQQFELLSRFAQLASISLDNARLYTASQEAMKRMDDANRRVTEQNKMLEGLSTQLSKYLSPQVYSQIFTGEQMMGISSKRKKLTVFFSDIVDFTETTESLESEELTGLLNRYLTEMTEVALAHGATVDKYVGDAVMLFFGDPESRGVKEDAEICVKMAIAMQRRMRDLQSEWRDLGLEKPFQLRIGINTGFCTVGNFGSEDRMDYTIIGNEVNLAARLQSSSALGGILLAHETYALVKNEVLAVEQEPITVKGFARPIRTYSVAGIYADLAAEGKIIHHQKQGVQAFVDLENLVGDDRVEAIHVFEGILSRLKS